MKAYKIVSFLFMFIIFNSNLLASREDLNNEQTPLLNKITREDLDHIYYDDIGTESLSSDTSSFFMPEERGPLKILSIDGGGIRGILPLYYLARLEKELQRPCRELFDLIAGTSTGGIIALALSIGHSAETLLDLYLRQGGQIFEKRGWTSGPFGPKYQASGLMDILHEYCGNYMLSDARVPVLVTSYEMDEGKPLYFCSHYPDVDIGQPKYDMLMSDAARATSAAPTYFEPAEVIATNSEGEEEILHCLDGGTFSNNPVIGGISYAHALYSVNRSESSYRVLSLGTGYKNISIPYNTGRWAVSLWWGLKLLPVFFDGPSRSDTEDMKMMLGQNFDRVTTELTYANSAMDDVSEDNIFNLCRDAKKMFSDHQEAFNKWCDIFGLPDQEVLEG